MKKTALIPCLLLLAASCGRGPDLEVSRKFQRAQEVFTAASTRADATPEDFLESAALYQEILDEGFFCGAVLYNQGNAFMKAGQRGRALAVYRQAKRYLPMNSYLNANLEYALGSSATSQAKRSLIDHLLFWKDWVSYPDKFLLILASAGMTLIFALAALILRGNRGWNRLKYAGLVLCLAMMLSGAYDVYRYEIVEHGVSISDGVIARKGNSESSEPAFTEALPEATEFEIRDRRDAWLLIRLKGGLEGWIPEKDAVVY